MIITTRSERPGIACFSIYNLNYLVVDEAFFPPNLKLKLLFVTKKNRLNSRQSSVLGRKNHRARKFSYSVVIVVETCGEKI